MSPNVISPSTTLDAVTAGSPPLLMLLVDLTSVMTAMVLRRRGPTAR